MNRWLAIALIIVGLGAVGASVHRMAFTGDETRYAAQGVALYSTGTLHPNAPTWAAFLDRSGLSSAAYPLASVAAVAPAIGPSIVFGAFLRLAGLDGGRWAAYVAGCIGIVALTLLLRSLVRPWIATWTIVIVTFSLPLVAYVRLVYPDVLLFALVAIALLLLRRERRFASVVVASALPFVHMRASLLAATLVAIVMFDAAQHAATRSKILRLGAFFGAAMILLATIQHRLYGNVLGPAFPSYPPSLARFVERAGFQLFDVRHGLLAYAPIYLIGIAGLIAAVLARDRFGTYAALALASYFVTFVWSTASESWTARFWVAAIPMLAIGISFWISRISQWSGWLPVVPCALLTLVNFGLYCREPAWFLENRRASVSYAELFFATHLHLGLSLPIDSDATGLPQDTTALPWLLAWFVVLVALLVCVAIVRGPVSRRALAIASFFTLTVPIVASVQRVVSPSDYHISEVHDGPGILIEPRDPPERFTALQFDDTLSLPWTADSYPRYLAVRCYNPGAGVVAFVEPSRPIVLLDECRFGGHILIRAIPDYTGRKIFSSIDNVTLMENAF